MISHLINVRGKVPIMTSHISKLEVLSGPERRRRWSTDEKLAIIQETYEPDAAVSIVARHYGIQPNQLFTLATSSQPIISHAGSRR